MSSQNAITNHVEIYGPSFSTFVRSVMLVCEKLQIKYTTGFELAGEMIDHKSDQHLALHPYAKFPVLKHGEFILPETAAICRYLQATFGNGELQEFTPQQLARIDAFCAIISIYIDKAIVRDYLLEFASPKGRDGEVRVDVVIAAQPEVRKALMVIDNELSQGDTLNNSKLSLADILVAPMLYYISTLPAAFNLLNEFNQVEDYFNNLMKLKHFKKILVKKDSA